MTVQASLRRSAVLAAALVLAARAHAQAPTSAGIVVELDAGQLVLDVGEARVREGDVLPIYRPVEVRQPVTGRMLRDRFLIGRVRVLQAGTQLSLARAEGATARELAVGDVVELAPPAPTRAPSAAPTPVAAPPRPSPTPVDPEQSSVLALFAATLGRPPEERIALYRAFLAGHERSPYRDGLLRDVTALHELETAAFVAPTQAEAEATTRTALAAASHAEPVTLWHEGQTPEIAVSAPPELARTVLLHARAVGAETFTTVSVPLSPNGAARIALPVASDRGDGVEYFVEVVGRSGISVALGPKVVAHRMPTDWPSGVGRSRARFSSEMVSFSTRAFDDWVLDVQGDFLYRVQAGWLYGVRLGLGTLYGRGGPIAQLDAPSPTSHVASFSSGFLEIELRPMSGFAVIGRLGVGLNRLDATEGQDATLAPGGQIRVRIGEERGVNLVLGGEFLPQGDRAFVALAFEVVHDFPMAAEVHVTNQPVWFGDIGVRVVYELGWRVSPVVQLALRLSVQGRQIDHVGPGAGLAATFDW